jgi:hypothetical protein
MQFSRYKMNAAKLADHSSACQATYRRGSVSFASWANEIEPCDWPTKDAAQRGRRLKLIYVRRCSVNLLEY